MGGLMKVFTFFYNRYETATTSRALYENGIDHNVLIHNADDKQKFIEGKTIYGTPIITNQPKGLAYQRNFALDMMEQNEWAVFMCDDFEKVIAYNFDRWMDLASPPIDMKNQREHKYTQKISLKQMFSTFDYLIELAETANIHLIGFAFNNNPRNNRKKFGHKGLVDGRFWILKKSELRFDLQAQLIDDVAWTAENLEKWGNNLVFNWIDPEFGRYTNGGFGSISQRTEQRKLECQYLVNKYPKTIRFAEKPGWETGTHIKIKGSGRHLELIEKSNGKHYLV